MIGSMVPNRFDDSTEPIPDSDSDTPFRGSGGTESRTIDPDGLTDLADLVRSATPAFWGKGGHQRDRPNGSSADDEPDDPGRQPHERYKDEEGVSGPLERLTGLQVAAWHGA